MERVILLHVTKVAPVFSITKVQIQEKDTKNEKYPRKKSETSFKSLLEKALRAESRVDVRC